jgi:hypothetical protein
MIDKPTLAICGVLLIPALAFAEEGMWTFDNPPVKQLKDAYNFTPTEQWLDHVRLASVRLNDGGCAFIPGDVARDGPVNGRRDPGVA